MKTLKTHLENQLALAKGYLNSAMSYNDTEQALNTINYLNNLINELYNKQQYLSKSELIKLSQIPISKDFQEFINDLLNLYIKMPLLETEATKNYPNLAPMKKIDINKLTSFYSELLTQEYGKNIINHQNFIILDSPVTKKLSFSFGQCIFYKLVNAPHLVLERHNNIRDYIVPARESVLLTDELNKQSFNNNTNLARYYMEMKAINKLEKTGLYHEAEKYKDIIIDSMISRARLCQKFTSNSSDLQKACSLNFIDQVIGYQLAQQRGIKLTSLIDNQIINNSGNPDLASVNTSYQQIIDETKNLAKDVGKIKVYK